MSKITLEVDLKDQFCEDELDILELERTMRRLWTRFNHLML
jgi:hypothetical protein